jgi:hypothetical protein
MSAVVRAQTPLRLSQPRIWWLPLKKKDREFSGFAPEEISLDQAARTVKTLRTRTDQWWSWDALRDVRVGNVNLSMYQFTDAALKYDSKTTASREEMYDWQRVGVTWQGAGNQQIVTVLFPRKPTPEKPQPDGTENDLTSITSLATAQGSSGFQAVTPSGVQVTYAAAKGPTTALAADGVAITGEALLVIRNPTARDVVRGVALGCTALTVKGPDTPVAHPDFEFTLPASLDAAALQIEPIYRPISPVQILPAADAFADEFEVSLACDTPHVVMTYTLDGTEPTPQSTRYRGPFKIGRTYVVKARAYRPGVERNPPHTSGTHATATSDARYTKKLWSTPEPVTPQAPGLNYEYCEGFWKDLWLAPGKVPPKQTGHVAELFDLTVIPEGNRPLGDKLAPREKTYAFRYTGYLQVPADGVYTLHAPHEFVYPDQIAGYELQVYIGHEVIPDNNGTKRLGELNLWYPATRLHGLGTWSVPLKAGFHEIKIVYIDFRMDGPQRLNRVAGVRDCVWSGERPALLISGSSLPRQPIPAAWLWH